MKRTLTIAIDSGETTCASKPGKFCSHVMTRRLGSEWICGLFRGDDGREVVLRDENGSVEGFLQRCPQCLAAEARR